MDPSASSCMRSAPLWGCMRNPPGEVTSPLHPYQQVSFFQQKADYSAYPDFSAPCLATAPHSFPREEHTFHHSDWHLSAATEARRRLNPELALSSGDMESSSPNLLDGSGCINEEYGGPGATGVRDSDKKAAKRKKDNAGECMWWFIRKRAACFIKR